MGTNIPSTIPEFISWCVAHGSQWTSNATLVGLTPAQATAFAALVTNLTKAGDDAEAARMESKDATLKLTNAVNAAHGLASIYVSTIKNYAQSTNNPNVYALGGVSPGSPPGVLPAPVAPDNFSAGVNTDGSLTIRWKVAQPPGVNNVVYFISRRINGGTGPFTLITTEGGRNKSYMDTTLPVGVDRVEYIVQPKRGNVLGPQSNVFAIQFGSVAGGGGMGIVSTSESAEGVRLAA